MGGVKQRVSLLTLGVADLGRARAFYEALGWRTGAEPGDDVVFFQAGEMVLALWDRARLAEDSGVEDGGGWGGMTLALNFGSPAEVDAAIEEARSAPARGSPASRPRPSGAATAASSSTPTATPGRSPTTRTGRSPRTAASGLAETAARRAHLNLVESSRRLFELDPGAEMEAGEGWLFGAGSADHPAISNAAFRLDDELEPGELLSRAREFFGERGRGFVALGARRRRRGRGADLGGGSRRPPERLRDAGDDPRRPARGASASPEGVELRRLDSAEDDEAVLADRRRGLPGHRLPARGLRLLPAASRTWPRPAATPPPSSPTSTARRSRSR